MSQRQAHTGAHATAATRRRQASPRGARSCSPSRSAAWAKENHRTLYREGTAVRTWRERGTDRARIRHDSDDYARGHGYFTRPVAELVPAASAAGRQRLAEGTWNDRYTGWERAGRPAHPWRPLVPGATACWQCGHQPDSVYHQDTSAPGRPGPPAAA